MATPSIKLSDGTEVFVPDVGTLQTLLNMAYVISTLSYDQILYLRGLHAGGTGAPISSSGFQIDRGHIQGEFLNREATNYHPPAPSALPIDLSPVIQTLRADLTKLDEKVEKRLDEFSTRVSAINPNWGTW